ncbi:FAD-binding oxidoreductase [Paracoccus seriniphilus]|uniref:D-lactate dehydrogenase (cytochrome) n=1 Tax=Paracoccus seriniphilus TaxID=184748 RepID=A0A239PUW6_9RHOB|nr:FAD-linked oxidase C-terminal domain-containing protein [Paracoccus seriniphilus]WCR15428.1 FAD-binding protein [Paracoccus seriniphilus]SNT73918.1 D-lactate dehydrogenase (cytochrome) [Paracoccus seriniphilus]
MNEKLNALLAQLQPQFAERLVTSEAMREHHGSGESHLPPAWPDAVIMVRSTQEVSDVLAACNEHEVPVIPFGAGSSIEGQIHAPHGGISLDMSAMDAILSVEEADMDCTVQCGVTRQALNEHLRATGLFFPVDLGAHATLGGMAATRASGTTTVRYGSMRDLVLGLTVVMPDGEIIRTGGRARKSSAGYDLTRLMVGSEGTLGVITELTLRLFGIPEASQTAMCSFDSIQEATETVVMALQCGLALNRIELADTLQMQAINRYSRADLPESPTLWVEMTGAAPTVENDMDTFEGLAESARKFERATSAEDASRIWRIRHDALYASRALRPGIKGISTDVCVPISALPSCIGAIQEVIATTSIQAPLVGHVGDGNFHLVLLYDPADEDEIREARHINGSLIKMAIEMGGTCTGEHGVGLGKKAYLPAEHGPALGVMRRIKRALDPQNIMNPGKIFDL